MGGSRTARYAAYDVPADYATDDAPGLLVEYWHLIRRHKAAVLVLGLAGMLLAVLVTLPQTPIYQARTSLEIQGVNENFLNLKSMDPSSALPDYSGDAYIQTQMKILQSDALLGRTIKALQYRQTSAESATAGADRKTSLRSMLICARPPRSPPSWRLWPRRRESAGSQCQQHPYRRAVVRFHRPQAGVRFRQHPGEGVYRAQSGKPLEDQPAHRRLAEDAAPGPEDQTGAK